MLQTQTKTLYSIPVIKATEYTRRWREKNTSTRAFTIDTAELNDIINELSSHIPLTRIRVYFGIKDDGAEALVLVGIDANGNDIVSYTKDGLEEPGTYDFTHPCPDTCDNDSVLNGD